MGHTYLTLKKVTATELRSAGSKINNSVIIYSVKINKYRNGYRTNGRMSMHLSIYLCGYLAIR